ncbi:MAG: glucose-1-phosphate thymidylyltransferase RfbA [Chthonomonadaceae bacterium]|nr:glucose-1-phosphate thymidylyltransferase RfbA [Chthonomonadaceae bacterium]
MKGIVLAGGTGTRLYPLTIATSKQLLPVFSKPMVYYPLSVLMMAGIRDICVITTPSDQDAFKRLLGNGSSFGVNLSYVVQSTPGGLAQAFVIAENFIASDRCALVLGDNIFYGSNLTELLKRASSEDNGATVFAYHVDNPSDYGVVVLDSYGCPTEIEEKPAVPRSHLAVTGLYFFDETVVERAKGLTPSSRGELEITDLNRTYLAEGSLNVVPLDRGFAWLDTGTYESMLQASNFVEAIEKRQGVMISCLEEIAYISGWIDSQSLAWSGAKMGNTLYGRYLLRLAEEGCKGAADER